MAKLLSDEVPEIYHYTTITGLKGIIESQTLWATHYAYLNDTEEIIHFKSQLSIILEPVVKAGLVELVRQAPTNQSMIDQHGGIEKICDEIPNVILRVSYKVLLGDKTNPSLAEPYVVSFCTPGNNREKEHGLLSQWRGYGEDGGYVVAFGTKKIEQLLVMEGDKWGYDELFGGDIVYSSSGEAKIHEEFGQYLDDIKNGVKELFSIRPNEQALDKLYSPIVRCSCRYKHWGFEEEKEVRIVAIPLSPEVRRMAQAEDRTLKPEKPKKHFVRRGLAVPYIDLFENISISSGKRLPITRIIVGPHPEKDKRRKAVKILLQQHGIEAPVSVSAIPYLC